MQDQPTKPDRPNKFEWQQALEDATAEGHPAGKLTHATYRVALAIWRCVGADLTGAWPALPTLSARTGCDKKTVRQALNTLVRLGWITRVKPGTTRTPAVYDLRFPAGWFEREPSTIAGLTPVIDSGPDTPKESIAGLTPALCGSHARTVRVPVVPEEVKEEVKEEATKNPVVQAEAAAHAEHAEPFAPPTADAGNQIDDFLAAIDTTDSTAIEEPEPAPTADTETAALFNLPALPALDAEVVDAEVVDAEPTPTTKPPTTPEQQATAAAYERTGKAFNFVAVRGIAKWAIHDRGETTDAVENAIVGVYELGRPVMKSTVGQWLDGIIGPNGARRRGPSKQDQKVLDYLATGPRLSAKLAAQRAHHTPALALAPTKPDSIF